MRKKRKAQAQAAAQETAPHVDWLVQYREEQRREEEENLENATTDAEKAQAALIQAKNAANYSAMVSNIMSMKHATASNIISNMKY